MNTYERPKGLRLFEIITAGFRQTFENEIPGHSRTFKDIFHKNSRTFYNQLIQWKKHYSYRTLHRGKHFNFKIASNKTTSGPHYFYFWNRFRVEIRVQGPWRFFRIRLSSHSFVLRFSVTMGRLQRNRPTIISIRSKSLFCELKSQDWMGFGDLKAIMSLWCLLDFSWLSRALFPM